MNYGISRRKRNKMSGCGSCGMGVLPTGGYTESETVNVISRPPVTGAQIENIIAAQDANNKKKLMNNLLIGATLIGAFFLLK